MDAPAPWSLTGQGFILFFRFSRAALDALITGRSRTSVTIAHRLSTIRSADQIAVVAKGSIVECGTHDELRDARGLYAELLAAQQ